MKTNRIVVVVVVAAFFAAASVLAGEAGKSVVLTKADLKWTALNDAGVAAAVVSGDMEKGPCRFFLKYPAGLVTPLHSHSADHHVTVVSGSITLNVGGKDHLLGPGDYFMLADKAPHKAKVEGGEDAVFFIEADGSWDVVMAQ
jgi:mannose-6-phosphate isomerase-like protein (cupin superfamily)